MGLTKYQNAEDVVISQLPANPTPEEVMNAVKNVLTTGIYEIQPHDDDPQDVNLANAQFKNLEYLMRRLSESIIDFNATQIPVGSIALNSTHLQLLDTDGNPISEIAKADLINFIGKVNDADKLDGIDATGFLRSNVNDTFTGPQLTINNTLKTKKGVIGTGTNVIEVTSDTSNVFFKPRISGALKKVLKYDIVKNIWIAGSYILDTVKEYTTTANTSEISEHKTLTVTGDYTGTATKLFYTARNTVKFDADARTTNKQYLKGGYNEVIVSKGTPHEAIGTYSLTRLNALADANTTEDRTFAFGSVSSVTNDPSTVKAHAIVGTRGSTYPHSGVKYSIAVQGISDSRYSTGIDNSYGGKFEVRLNGNASGSYNTVSCIGSLDFYDSALDISFLNEVALFKGILVGDNALLNKNKIYGINIPYQLRHNLLGDLSTTRLHTNAIVGEKHIAGPGWDVARKTQQGGIYDRCDSSRMLHAGEYSTGDLVFDAHITKNGDVSERNLITADSNVVLIPNLQDVADTATASDAYDNHKWEFTRYSLYAPIVKMIEGTLPATGSSTMLYSKVHLFDIDLANPNRVVTIDMDGSTGYVGRTYTAGRITLTIASGNTPYDKFAVNLIGNNSVPGIMAVEVEKNNDTDYTAKVFVYKYRYYKRTLFTIRKYHDTKIDYVGTEIGTTTNISSKMAHPFVYQSSSVRKTQAVLTTPSGTGMRLLEQKLNTIYVNSSILLGNITGNASGVVEFAILYDANVAISGEIRFYGNTKPVLKLHNDNIYNIKVDARVVYDSGFHLLYLDLNGVVSNLKVLTKYTPDSNDVAGPLFIPAAGIYAIAAPTIADNTPSEVKVIPFNKSYRCIKYGIADRNFNIIYYNNTGAPIEVHVTVNGTAGQQTWSLYTFIGSNSDTMSPLVIGYMVNASTGGALISGSFIVPTGHYYKVTRSSGSLYSWHETRL